MNDLPGVLLVGAVAVVGVFHTIVPDHWVPIALIARQRAWSRRETGLAALQAGTGHVLSTVLIGLVVWLAGVAVATRFGHVVETGSSIALVAFGGWIAISAWRDLRGQDAHLHGHGGHGHDQRMAHLHRQDHTPEAARAGTASLGAEPPLRIHRHKTTARTTLLLILGSSPMVEGIPPFFAAAKYGNALIAVMAAVFAVSTIGTYMLLSVYSTVGLRRVRLGAFERYGEVMSGAFIALLGVAFWLWPVF